MSDENGEKRTAPHGRYWRDIGFAWLTLALCTAASWVLRFVVLARFEWFVRFDASHRFWAELIPIWVAVFTVGYLFRRNARVAEHVAFVEDLREGRVKRMSLPSRSGVMLVCLGLVITGSLLQGPYAKVCIVLGVPVLLLFAVEELNIILRPGDTVSLTDQRDELLAFFKGRTLQLGYSIAILSLLTLYLASLLASQYVRVLLPILLTISLLAPSFLYHRLDRLAGADE